MKPSEQCKKAGLKGLAELVEISGVSEQTLINWSRSKPKLFDVVISGAAQKRTKTMMTAKLIDKDGEVLEEVNEIKNDIDLEAMEPKAIELHAAIHWYRESDGQAGYWTPSGASFDPHYYE
jgi:hypothetical protein